MSVKSIDKTKSAYPEINDIRDDLSSLKNDAGKLAGHVASDGKEQLNRVVENVQEQSQALKETASSQLGKIQAQVKQNPLQSVAIAFGVGLLASMLLGRR
ncbi:MAG: DUF883 domain-containing protein [Alphaproteobacteria bacterium]|nr:DUF883 domain-containing protein [Alphaproteobacteria bacterium]